MDRGSGLLSEAPQFMPTRISTNTTTATAIVTGIHGQDGFYLASLLSRRGYRIVGLSRHDEKRDSIPEISNVEIMPCDLLDGELWVDVLHKYAPREIYNLAARASSTQLHSEPALTAEVNGLAVARMLEAVKSVDKTIRFCQASSSEMFGMATESPQSETTPFRPRNPYGVAKLFAHGMIGTFRDHFDLFACSAILFNHESPRRPPEFVTRKVSMAVARIQAGLADSVELGSLDAVRDWGHAADHMDAMWRMLQAPQPDDYVVATGIGHTVRDLCEIAFEHVGLDYRMYVKQNMAPYGHSDTLPLIGNSAKARAALGWRPAVRFRKLVHAMVDADIANLALGSD